MPLLQPSSNLKKSKLTLKKNAFSRKTSALTFEQQILLAAITGKQREFLIAHPEFKLTSTQQKKFAEAQKKLVKGLPLAYILGYQWFFGRKFLVNKNVLIPRPETEQLVELAVEFCRAQKSALTIDVGTGSGAIISSIAAHSQSEARQAESNSKDRFSKNKFFGIDISSKALEVAKKNSKGLGIKFFKGNLLEPVAKILSQIKSRSIKPRFGKQKLQLVLITANLPYLSKKELREPSIKKEPRLALYGGVPSHSLIEQLLKQISGLKMTDALVLLEFNYNQGAQIKKLTKKYLPGATCEIKKDLRGFDRIAAIYIGNANS